MYAIFMNFYTYQNTLDIIKFLAIICNSFNNTFNYNSKLNLNNTMVMLIMHNYLNGLESKKL